MSYFLYYEFFQSVFLVNKAYRPNAHMSNIIMQLKYQFAIRIRFRISIKRLLVLLPVYSRLEFGDRQPANAGQKYLLTCHPASGRQKTAGQPISRQSPKLQLILVHIYRLRLNLLQNQRTSFQFHFRSHGCHVCKQNAHGAG